jgi:cytoskeletal protein CcmA (bactofilin family)
VLGTARCRRLQVEDGGQITGRIEMLGDTMPALAHAPVYEAHK